LMSTSIYCTKTTSSSPPALVATDTMSIPPVEPGLWTPSMYFAVITSASRSSKALPYSFSCTLQWAPSTTIMTGSRSYQVSTTGSPIVIASRSHPSISTVSSSTSVLRAMLTICVSGSHACYAGRPPLCHAGRRKSHLDEFGRDRRVLQLFRVEKFDDHVHRLGPLWSKFLHHLPSREIAGSNDKCSTSEVSEASDPGLGVDSVLKHVLLVLDRHLADFEKARSVGD
jgi:hypothetical protein